MLTGRQRRQACASTMSRPMGAPPAGSRGPARRTAARLRRTLSALGARPRPAAALATVADVPVLDISEASAALALAPASAADWARAGRQL